MPPILFRQTCSKCEVAGISKVCWNCGEEWDNLVKIKSPTAPGIKIEELYIVDGTESSSSGYPIRG